MDPDHLALAEALGLGGADVVGAKVFHHAGAGEPGDIGQGNRGEDDRGEQIPVETGRVARRHREPTQPHPNEELGHEPSTKMGTEMTATVLTFTNESKNLSFRIPAQTPAVTPITISMMKA